jgi:hypothetical protein
MMRHVFVLFALSGFVLVASACGSSDDSSGDNYTLDNVCDLLPPKICAAEQGCCSSSGIGFDQTGCEDYQKSECQKNVADAKAGTMTFNAGSIDSCLSQIKTVFDACRIPPFELEQYLGALGTCANVFVGQKDIGAACDRDAECKPGGPDEFVNCSETTKKCARATWVGSGAACGFDPNALALCKSGLYCDPTSSTCKTSVPKGQTCTPAAGECGLGLYCELASQTCVDAKAEGEACVSAFECRSIGCTALKCDPVDPVVHADGCGM